MGSLFSIYLDFIRIFAASFVVYSHSNVRFLLPEILPLAQFAHSAVVVFFVLSGYVIAYVSTERERNWLDYSSSRFSRILSLSVLAVAITLIADIVGRAAAPNLYKTIPIDLAALRAFISVFFLNEIWFLSVMTFSNVPYWSLGYEIWYYFLFGIILYCPPKYRNWGIAATCLFLGPKILLLLPCWLIGVAAYRVQREKQWSTAFAAVVWLASATGFWYYHHIDLMRAFGEGWLRPTIGLWLFDNLTFSHYFAADWVLSVLVALNFVASRRLLSSGLSISKVFQKRVNQIGALTFALYIIHFPLLYCYGALASGWTPGRLKWATVTAAAGLSAFAIGVAAERLRLPLRALFIQVVTRATTALGEWRVARARHGTPG